MPAPSDDAYYINNLAISSDCRGQKLLDYLCQQAREQNYRCIELDVARMMQVRLRFIANMASIPFLNRATINTKHTKLYLSLVLRDCDFMMGLAVSPHIIAA